MNKKIFLFLIIFLVGLTLSACSSEKTVNKVGPKPSQTNNVIPVSTQTTEIPLATSTVKTFSCGDAPVKISDLKVGDIFNSHKIKELSGRLCEKDCDANSGTIKFEGEEIVTGTIIVSPEFVYNISFIPDSKNWMPAFVFNNENINIDPSIKGIGCGDQSFYLLGKENDENYIPVLNMKLPDFYNFLSNSSDGDKYPLKVTIKIKDLSQTFSSGGNGVASATLVDIIKVIK